jgi:hypothetical protein
MTIVDVVKWRDVSQGCNRCAGYARYYITPYFEPTKRVCPTCCVELNTLNDAYGWPELGRYDI